MIVVIGPIDSPTAVAELHAAAQDTDACPSDQVDVWDASTVYLLPTWRRCPRAVADVAMAEELCLPIRELVPLPLRVAA